MPENSNPFENLTAPIAAPPPAATPEQQGALRAAQLPSNAELPTGEVCSAPEAASILPPAPTPTTAPTSRVQLSAAPPRPPRPPRSNAKANPFKPENPDEIAAFVRLWHDPAYTLDMIARRYRCHGRTIQKWANAFGLSTRAGDEAPAMIPQALAGAALTDSADNPSPAPLDASAARLPAADPRWNPLADPEIETALSEIRDEARKMTAHSELKGLSRKLARLRVLAAMKAPSRSWPSLQVELESLCRAVLSTLKTEAGLPATGADPVVLRREAAGQMMRELKSVLNAAEQAELARLMKTGVDRLVSRQRPVGPPSENPEG